MQNTTLSTDILILGAGIGGYETFRALHRQLKRHGIQKKVLIIDWNNYFTFTPLLHEAAAGAVEPSHCAIPMQELVYGTEHRFLKAQVQKVLPPEKKVITSAGEITYQYCVVALGSGVNYYNIPGAKEHTYSVRTLMDAVHLRNNLIEKLETCGDTLSLVIVGGGFTGVEVAGQIAFFAQHDAQKLYPSKKISLTLVQNNPTLTPELPTKAQQRITKRLQKLGVEIRLNSAVKQVDSGGVYLAEEVLPSSMTIWCAGVQSVAPFLLDESFCERGRIPITNFLNHPQDPMLYAVGDIALGKNIGGTNPYPPLGEVAEAEGDYVAQHIIASLEKKPLKPFFFKSKGTLMPIGDGYGLLIRGNTVIDGFLAWWIRRTVYVWFMPGPLRKLRIVVDWTLHLFGFSYILNFNLEK